MGKPLVTVVCTANICRSPMGQVVLQERARTAGLAVEVCSAGVQALVGKSPDEQAIAALKRASYPDLADKRAEQLLLPQVSESQLVLVMESRHKQWVMKNFPAHSGKIWLMKHWIDRSDVADPIGQSSQRFDVCLAENEQAVDAWIPKLRNLF